ncbi:MAG: hypothetical protein GX491_16740 [Chloroflexi bacterium]|nr:hypothetical protein [Chloroflexota bacterium]
MAFEEGIEAIVTILTRYYMDGGREIAERYGDQGPSLAAEVGDMLEEQLEEDSPYGQLWAEYKANPADNEAELIGVLEVMEEVNPELTLRLKGYYAAFQQLDQPGAGDLIETGEPEDTIRAEEIESIKSYDDMDDDDEYREENTYLRGNVEDHSTSAMYYEGQDTSIEPNESEEE